MSLKNDSIFYIETYNGYTFKMLSEIISSFNQRPTLQITENNIKINFLDREGIVCFNITLDRKNFKSYKCSKPLNISINIQHFKKHMTNVKKKDTLTLYINEAQKQLGFIVTQNKSERKESNFITYMEEAENSISMNMFGDDDNYEHPKVLLNTDFQKLKKICDINKQTISIEMQKTGNTDYLSFQTNVDSMYGSITEFGDKDENSPLYKAEFQSHIFKSLIKLASITTQVRIYEPKVIGLPLQIESAAQGLGIVKVFVKDELTIQMEKSSKSN